MKILYYIATMSMIISCASATTKNNATEMPISADPEYGYTSEKPIKVGGDIESGPENERAYLDKICGPDYEELSYHRKGSCCGYENKNAPMGYSILDVYELTYNGIDKPIVLYLDMYEEQKQYVPVGLTSCW